LKKKKPVDRGNQPVKWDKDEMNRPEMVAPRVQPPDGVEKILEATQQPNLLIEDL